MLSEELLTLMMSMGNNSYRRFLPSPTIPHRLLFQNKKKRQKKNKRLTVSCFGSTSHQPCPLFPSLLLYFFFCLPKKERYCSSYSLPLKQTNTHTHTVTVTVHAHSVFNGLGQVPTATSFFFFPLFNNSLSGSVYYTRTSTNTRKSIPPPLARDSIKVGTKSSVCTNPKSVIKDEFQKKLIALIRFQNKTKGERKSLSGEKTFPLKDWVNISLYAHAFH